ncbi:GNAT family N-acetyltransferase [Lentibacillus sediminis]|uniref:GNAT family N-acetyltransferase n=1 Tax=Lentibacillus sediminis TaxID=1940529 RepID=UPI000C1C5930|nr:GNAT family N-acetyltransferase [Lentibacillus sediminis]
MEIREYQASDERGWVRCRTLSFLDTAYFDNVLPKKETYEHEAIELVAIIDQQVVGLIDVECEQNRGTVCTGEKGLGGMIWHIAVHPDFQRKGIGKQLLAEAETIAKEKKLDYLEAWTRDDQWVRDWYEKNGFAKGYSYLQVHMEGEELGQLQGRIPGMRPVEAWAHYTGEKAEEVKTAFSRVYECCCYHKNL